MGNALRLSVLAVAAAEDLPWCDEDDRYDTQPVYDRGQYIGWQTPKVAAALDKDREGLGPTGRYCLLSGEGPKIADRFKPRSQEDEWHLPHLDDLRERHEARRGYWAEEGLERFAEHRDRITELTDAAHDAHERARWDRDERAHNRAVAMDVFAEKEREDWAKMEEELAQREEASELAQLRERVDQSAAPAGAGGLPRRLSLQQLANSIPDFTYLKTTPATLYYARRGYKILFGGLLGATFAAVTKYCTSTVTTFFSNNNC